jgi:predicted MFS family arabinose efflux permease
LNPAAATADGTRAGAFDRTRWALMAGNFAIGCGVMAVAGAMNDLVTSLQVSVALGGQLVTIGAVVMAVASPTLAAMMTGYDRRRLLCFWLSWFAIGHLLQALLPEYTALAVVRALTLLGAAVYTPQAAATIGALAQPESRGRAITFVFIGWALASVLGLPGHAYIAETIGWRWGFALSGLLAGVAALWVWHALPDGVRSPPMPAMSLRTVFASPALMAIVCVTALSAASQFTLFAYMAPYYKRALGATPGEIGLLFMAFGVAGLLGNVLMMRNVDRLGPAHAAALSLACIALSMLAWPLGTDMATMLTILLPWALGGFAAMSAQQARLGHAAPALAPVLLALNSSAFYIGQAAGAASGGAIVAATGFGALHWVALAWALLAIALSLWAQRAAVRPSGHD